MEVTRQDWQDCTAKRLVSLFRYHRLRAIDADMSLQAASSPSKLHESGGAAFLTGIELGSGRKSGGPPEKTMSCKLTILEAFMHRPSHTPQPTDSLPPALSCSI